MTVVSRGFGGRFRRPNGEMIPPGQYLVDDFPVLTAGPTPSVTLDEWNFSIVDETGSLAAHWTWDDFLTLPTESPVVDIHCVTKWSKLRTRWEGVSVDTLLDGVESSADFVLAVADGGYTSNFPLADLTGGRAWVVYGYEGEELDPEHGGPARLLVPHLYFWKSAKWIRGLMLRNEDEPGFWETLGYHNYGDPWREQRYWGD
jgi:DMSO/TMAO reductase YedYZ molybdopterin-dependent catalytic subunit